MTPSDPYVSSSECRSCHAEQYASWYASYHRTMTQPATAQTVRGDFADVVLDYGAQRIALSRDADHFAMEVLPAPTPEHPVDQRQARFALPVGRAPVTMVTGSHHMQVYWYETGRGRELGQLPFAYLHEDARWVPRQMLFLRPPERIRALEIGRWNSDCLHCHSTRAEPQLDPEGRHDTRVAELGIACEACHGPGRAHVAQFSSPVARYARHLSKDSDAARAIVQPARLDAARASEICSQCHANWQPKKEHARALYKTGMPYRPGEDPEKTMWLFAPSRKAKDWRVISATAKDPEYEPGQFWSDGQARVSGREYNGMIDSKCMQSGELSCLSCHQMHRARGDSRTLAQWADDQLAPDKGNEHGDAACASCHAELVREPGKHTRHAANTAGSRCYDCHMPHTSWGLLKAMRSHRITSPSAQETLETGRPNACSLCHLDKSLAWTARMLHERFGVEPPAADKLTAPEHTLAAGVALSLRGDAAQRALIAAAMGRVETQRSAGSAWMPAVLGVLMDDPYDAVRYAAGRSLRSLPGFERVSYDFVVKPSERRPVAEEIARRAAPQVIAAARHEALSTDLPLTDQGVLAPEPTQALLSQRDQRAVHLLE